MDAPPPEPEAPLEGGNTHVGVVRVGSTVRRPTGPWTPAVHALLRHLEAVGFDAAPRALGVDDAGREILTYADGDVVWPDRTALVADDDGLADVARIIRSFHDAVSSFPSDATHAWSDRGGDPVGPAEVLAHNDLAPWNLVHRPDGGWTFIDWDLAAPGRRDWDLAWALLGFIPLMPFSTLTDDETRHRLSLFRNAYGADLVGVSTLEVAVERCRREAHLIHTLGSRGEEPYATLLVEGHFTTWDEAARHVTARLDAWRSSLG